MKLTQIPMAPKINAFGVTFGFLSCFFDSFGINYDFVVGVVSEVLLINEKIILLNVAKYHNQK